MWGYNKHEPPTIGKVFNVIVQTIRIVAVIRTVIVGQKMFNID